MGKLSLTAVNSPVNIALATKPKLRFSGRSFLAFVIEPAEPVDEWLADLDKLARQSIGFFSNRPVIVDLSALEPDRIVARSVVEAIKARGVRVIAVEGADPAWFDSSLAPIARGKESARIIDFIENGNDNDKEGSPEGASAATRLIDGPVRSGQSIFHANGDLTVVGSVASGAEVAASGSIHIYGTLRGRAIAGAMGDSTARIFCRRFEAELIAIDGCYQTAEQSPVDLIDKPVQIRLNGDTFEMNVSD
jgi:septum site-determining protein MinC